MTSVDHDDDKVYVAMTKDEIKNAPDYEESSYDDAARASHENYYGSYSLR